MKIVCDKHEFSTLVRCCQCTEEYGDCTDCLVSGLCRNGSANDKGIITGIEDICEIVNEE